MRAPGSLSEQTGVPGGLCVGPAAALGTVSDGDHPEWFLSEGRPASGSSAMGMVTGHHVWHDIARGTRDRGLWARGDPAHLLRTPAQFGGAC